MASLKDIKKRIGSVKNTQQITKAMKMVAAAKLRRAQDAAVSARPYAEKLHAVMSSLAQREDGDGHALLNQRGTGRALIVLMTADRGLCGGFNANVSKEAERFIRSNEQGFDDIDLMIIGRKGRDFLKNRVGKNITKVHEDITSEATYKTAQLIGQEVVDAYSDEKYDAVYVIYNAFKSAIEQLVTVERVLPIQPKVTEEIQEDSIDYLYEPNRGEVLAQLLPKMVEVQIFRALLESNASEQGARMSSMDSASRNAAEMIDKLTLQYNRARQAAITKELMEIISGAESIK
ncbi:MAG: F0F1 ATP synthase subunit gamma [Deltaproteobacteria bacterium]|jgi:F-type H+-transporting ATPase subunit gamma|nr:F0F1 ATP synthase subunit gamma [Deltaproteobacteria bacterium]MCW8893469.1 F0F1 ATP synthase subunit gamma [Deltaproteobacteria bacterium]MCW9050626.1 F0F1 ATP synthase subunit gamma [Deltaproteobacteria bacterium]